MPSRLALARRRLATARRPRVVVGDHPTMTIEWDVPVEVRDGTVLRVNVFRPTGDAAVPALLSAHPYGKDAIPARSRTGRRLNPQFRLFPQPETIHLSDLTSWEAPDPAFWVAHGYAVVNADLRGAGTSDGVGTLFSAQEADDHHDLVEWVGTRPWCTGKVGLDGVSYLAISQYRVAATRPPHLAAMCPWEGFSDLYRDFARPGGVREDGFSIIWSAATRRAARVRGNLRREVVRRPERDDWYVERTPDLERIEVPMLVCASFSDHSLHTRGSFEAFRRSGSSARWLTTHRGGKWSRYYSAEASEERLRFFDHALKGADNGWDRRPPVRIRVHERGDRPVDVVDADAWPPRDLDVTTLHLDAATGGIDEGPPRAAAAPLRLPQGRRRFRWSIPRDLDVVGPMALTLSIVAEDATDANLFVAVRKLHHGREVHFEGSYGFAGDVVTRGWQRLAHRALDEELSTPLQPVHRHDRVEPLPPGEVVPVHIALLPHATRFRAGDELVVELRGRWLFPRNPLFGQFPAGYRRSPPARLTVHTGGATASTLRLGVRTIG